VLSGTERDLTRAVDLSPEQNVPDVRRDIARSSERWDGAGKARTSFTRGPVRPSDWFDPIRRLPELEMFEGNRDSHGPMTAFNVPGSDWRVMCNEKVSTGGGQQCEEDSDRCGTKAQLHHRQNVVDVARRHHIRVLLV
jgi:hypothetical protein